MWLVCLPRQLGSGLQTLHVVDRNRLYWAPDQAPGAGEGVWAEFFGRPAYTITLAGRLARSTGATVLMAVSCKVCAWTSCAPGL